MRRNLSRRTFLKSVGVSAAAAGLSLHAPFLGNLPKKAAAQDNDSYRMAFIQFMSQILTKKPIAQLGNQLH